MFMVSVAVSQNQVDIASKPQAIHRGLEARVILRLAATTIVIDNEIGQG